jgi:tRNA modification GTPase
VSIEGIPVELIDTAGLRDAADEAERIGIAKSREAMADADVVLLVLDAAAITAERDLSPEEWSMLNDYSPAGRPMVAVWNKCDLLDGRVKWGMIPRGATGQGGPPQVRTSAVTGEGIAELRAAILAAVAGSAGGVREAGMLTNLRQHQAVERALGGLDAATVALAESVPHEMILLDLYDGLRGLDALTGATTTEDVLRLIFSTFCIGK